MTISSVTIGSLILYAFLPFYLYTSFHQVYHNWKTRSADALSAYAMLLHLSLACIGIVYVVLLNQPLVCWIMSFVTTTPFIVLCLQKYYYSHLSQVRQTMKYGMITIILLCLALCTAGAFLPIFVGHVAGWIKLVINMVRATPQIIHNWQRGSVKGLTGYYIAGKVSRVLVNLTTTLLLLLPLQSILIDVYDLLLVSILLGQYYYYSCSK